MPLAPSDSYGDKINKTGRMTVARISPAREYMIHLDPISITFSYMRKIAQIFVAVIVIASTAQVNAVSVTATVLPHTTTGSISPAYIGPQKAEEAKKTEAPKQEAKRMTIWEWIKSFF